MFSKKATLISLLSLLLLVFSSCSSTDDDTNTNPAAIDTVASEFEVLEAAGDAYFTSDTSVSGKGINIEIVDAVSNLDSFIILDIRSAVDYASGHLKGAINITSADVIASWVDTATINKTILCVCYTGQGASNLTCALNLMGIDAQNLLFGMCSATTPADSINGTLTWTTQIALDEGYKLEKTANTIPAAGDLPVVSTGKTTVKEIVQASYTGLKGITAADVFAAVATNPDSLFIVNYWSDADYSENHIVGAYQYTPTSSLGMDELLKNLPTDKQIVVYCYSGQTSAQVTTYLNMLGYDSYSLKFGVNGFDQALIGIVGHEFKTNEQTYSAFLTK